jgi:hypothetical protein
MSKKAGLRSKLAGFYAKTHLRYARESRPVNFRKEFAEGGPILVIMPREASDFEAANRVLRYLKFFCGGSDSPVRIHAYLHETFRTWIDERLISASYAWVEKDLTLLGLPDQALLNRVADLEPGVVIDLNLEEDLAASYLCGMVGASVRMCLGRRQSPWYNLEMDIPICADDLKLTYLSFARQLHRCFYQDICEFPENLDTL